MFCLVKTEIWKLKRYYILWAGILLMMLSVLLTIFSTTAIDGTVWTFSLFAEQVIKNNTTTIFPMCITLVVGYIIMREEKDDTLKILLTVPVSYRRLLWGKMIVGVWISLILGLASGVFTVAAQFLMGFPGFSAVSVAQAFLQITFNCLFLYLAVMPIIVIAARMSNGHVVGTIIAFVYGYCGMFAAGNGTLADIYPVTASLGLIGYRSYDPGVHWNMIECLLSVIISVLISAAFVFTAREREPGKTVKKAQKAVVKKGW